MGSYQIICNEMAPAERNSQGKFSINLFREENSLISRVFDRARKFTCFIEDPRNESEFVPERLCGKIMLTISLHASVWLMSMKYT